jgi:hypothetical protein
MPSSPRARRPEMPHVGELRAPRPGAPSGPAPESAGIAAVSWGEDRIDRFWVGPEGDLLHAAFDGARWLETESLGGTPASTPGVTAWAIDELQVFAVFPDGELWNRYWDGARWHAWESLGGALDPGAGAAASSWSADRIDVWAIGVDGRTWHRFWDGARWVDWEQLEG